MLLCYLLDYLQQRSPAVVFRDLKPSNVILSPEGRLVLVDFGIARYFKEGQINDTTDFGSPGYASPEQYEGSGQTDGRSDIYSLGVILHEMLSGKRPARGGTRGSQIEALRQINPALSPALSGLVAVATRQEPMYRFQTAHAFYLALERTRSIEERRTYQRHAVLADDGTPGSPATPMDVPMPDTWKLENGQWFWYLDLSAGRDTPFGHTKPAPEGTGVIAGGAVRAVMTSAGIQNVLTKSIGTTNPHNVIKATFDALKKLKNRADVAALRGKTAEEL